MTPERRACLEAIKALTVGGVSPTVRELQTYLGKGSVSGVQAMLDELIAEGHLAKRPFKSRSLVVLTDNEAYTAPVLQQLDTDVLLRLGDRISAILAGRRRAA